MYQKRKRDCTFIGHLSLFSTAAQLGTSANTCLTDFIDVNVKPTD